MFENQSSTNNIESPSLPPYTEVSEISSPKSVVAVNIPLECSDEIQEMTPKSRIEEEDSFAIFNNFINYVEFHSIQPSDIWEGRHYLPLMLFLDICQKKLGYKFSLKQIKRLREMSEQGNVRKQHFACLNLWKNTLVCNYQSELYPQASISRVTQLKQNQSGGVMRMSHQKNTQSRSSQTVFKSRISLKKRTTYDQINSNFLKSVYTNEHNKDRKLEALREDMEMNALQKKWEFVVMVGQMNKWIEETTKQSKEQPQVRPVFKIINNQINFIIVREEGDTQQIVPEVVFIKRYKAMKKKQTTKLDQKEINRTIQNLAETNVSKAQASNSKLTQRDKQLNEALLHIMRIRNTLQTQYKILTESAINT